MVVREKACTTVKLYLHKAISEHVWVWTSSLRPSSFSAQKWSGWVHHETEASNLTVCPYEEVITEGFIPPHHIVHTEETAANYHSL